MDPLLGWLLSVVFSALLFGLPSAKLLRPYGRARAGLLIGTLLGPFGLLAAFVERWDRNRQRRAATDQTPMTLGSPTPATNDGREETGDLNP